MKIQSTRRNSGFTLVELLVVIAIIAVLAGVAFTAGASAVMKAKKMTALTTATAIEQAVNNFVTENGSFPKAGITGDEKIATADTSPSFNVEFLNILLGIEKSQTPLNSKGLKYLTVKQGKGKKDGLIYRGGGAAAENAEVLGLYDPWGGPYLVQFDGDYDDTITAKTASEKASKVIRGKKVIVWTNGANNTKDQSNSKKGKNTDAVKTWN
jgi:prepilin-type N-terminal cleavage/methylation domain-containing protein